MPYSRRAVAALLLGVGCRPSEKSGCSLQSDGHDTLIPGQAYEFFRGERISGSIRHIQYHGSNLVAFLDENKEVIVPDQARQYARPDGSVPFNQGGRFTFRGDIYGRNEYYLVQLTFERFEENRASIHKVILRCT